jgi:cyclic pyranopterin phosphate synthase
MTTTLIDQFNRRIDYIRISVTDRCDFRCLYCMSEEMNFLPKKEMLTLEEIARIVNVFTQLGVTKVRVTGGEPLVRKNIDWLFRNLGKIVGLDELTLTTNGSQLKKKSQMLKEAGVKRINVSLDSINPNTFKVMTRTGSLEDVLEGINSAIKLKFEKIKINTVLMKNINENELFDLVNYAIDNKLDISFIEEMPLGDTDLDRKITSISNDIILTRLNNKFDITKTPYTSGGPANYLQIKNTDTKIGLISPHSHNFCGDCNRVRISCKGELFLCLGHEEKIELMPLIRNHPNNDKPLIAAIINSMKIKPKAHTFDLKNKKPAVVRFMSHTGG